MLLKKKKLYAIKSKAWGESNLNPFEFGPLHFNLGLYKQQTLKTTRSNNAHIQHDEINK
jgi:hypothetical protein